MQSYIINTQAGTLTINEIAPLIGLSAHRYIDNLNLLYLAPGKDSIGIDQIKQAVGWYKTLKADSTGKILIVNSADSMTTEAQNALLKLLEEPGDNNTIVLCSANPDILLPTISSRCQLINQAHDNYHPISTKDNVEIFLKLIQLPPAKRLTNLEENKIANSNADTRLLLKNIINYLRQNDIPNRYYIIKQAVNTLIMLEHNVNTRLAIETFLLDLPTTH